MKQILSERRKSQVCRIFDWMAILAGAGIFLQVLFFAYGVSEIGMKAVCDLCIWMLHRWETWTGWSYEAINVVLFIFLEPLAIGFSILLFFFHKYTFSHVLMAIGNIAAFWLVTLVNFALYDILFQYLIGSCK